MWLDNHGSQLALRRQIACLQLISASDQHLQHRATSAKHEPLLISNPTIKVLGESVVEAQKPLYWRHVPHHLIFDLASEENQLFTIYTPALIRTRPCGYQE
jgi:hypothetical protein